MLERCSKPQPNEQQESENEKFVFDCLEVTSTDSSVFCKNNCSAALRSNMAQRGYRRVVERTCRSFNNWILTTHHCGNRRKLTASWKRWRKKARQCNYVSCKIHGGLMKTQLLACCLTTCWSVKKSCVSFYEHVCGHMRVRVCVCADKQVLLLCTHKSMTRLTLNLKAIIHAEKCEGTGFKSGVPCLRGWRETREWEKKKNGVLWTRIVCVKVFGPSAVRRDRWFSG